MNRPSLKQVLKRRNRLAKTIEFQKAITKEGDNNTFLDKIITAKGKIDTYVTNLTDPKKAVRCALPKKQQRKMGLLPQLNAA